MQVNLSLAMATSSAVALTGAATTDSDGAVDPATLPPTTISCAACERILGDTSSLHASSRDPPTLTLATLISTTLSVTPTISPDGSIDEFCTYRTVYCGKCGATVGKKYLATTPALAHQVGYYTVSLAAVGLYTHGSDGCSVPLVAREGAAELIRPRNEELRTWIEQIMSVVVGLREEQEDIIAVLTEVRERIARLGDDAQKAKEKEKQWEGKVGGPAGEKDGDREGLENRVVGLELRLNSMRVNSLMAQQSLKELEPSTPGTARTRSVRQSKRKRVIPDSPSTDESASRHRNGAPARYSHASLTEEHEEEWEQDQEQEEEEREEEEQEEEQEGNEPEGKAVVVVGDTDTDSMHALAQQRQQLNKVRWRHERMERTVREAREAAEEDEREQEQPLTEKRRNSGVINMAVPPVTEAGKAKRMRRR